MNRKSKALKALLALAIVIALCMFFARTVQTITTPKVQRISATKGKLEQKISLTGELYFQKTESMKLEGAKKLAMTVEQVNVRPGHYVSKGDVIFTAFAPEYESKMEELRTKRDDKVREYTEEYAGHILLKQTTRQNDMYNEMMEGMAAYYTARYNLVSQATAEGYALPGDDAGKAAVTDGSEALNALSAAFGEALALRDAKVQQLSDLYNGKIPGVYRIGDTTFEYIKKVDKLRGEIDELDQQMLELAELNESLLQMVAPHDGYITEIELKSGDSYDGSKPAFAMTAEGDAPMLRAEVTSVDKTLREGLKITFSDGETASEISGLETAADGKKYALVKLDSKIIRAAGGLARMLSEEQIPLTLIYKASKSTTLLPASAVRSEGSGSDYVYVVGRTYGGLLDSSGYKVTKQTVTVLERGDQVVSVAEDLSYREIADREDRALTDGQAVMDYVD